MDEVGTLAVRMVRAADRAGADVWPGTPPAREREATADAVAASPLVADVVQRLAVVLVEACRVVARWSPAPYEEILGEAMAVLGGGDILVEHGHDVGRPGVDDIDEALEQFLGEIADVPFLEDGPDDGPDTGAGAV